MQWLQDDSDEKAVGQSTLRSHILGTIFAVNWLFSAKKTHLPVLDLSLVIPSRAKRAPTWAVAGLLFPATTVCIQIVHTLKPLGSNPSQVCETV